MASLGDANRIGLQPVGFGQHFRSRQAGHALVTNDDGNFPVVQELHGGGAAVRKKQLAVFVAKQSLERQKYVFLVVDQEDRVTHNTICLRAQ
jgi:hypothetical protein